MKPQLQELKNKNPFKGVAQRVEQNNMCVDEYWVDNTDKSRLGKYADSDKENRIQIDVSPSPFLGINLNRWDKIKVVLLGLNPGYGGNQNKFNKLVPQRQKKYAELEARELRLESEGFGSVIVSGRYKDVNGEYWFDKLKKGEVGIDRIGNAIFGHEVSDDDLRMMGDKMALIDLFPYHTVNRPQLPEADNHLKCQEFIYDLVHQCIVDNKLIVITRSVNAWYSHTSQKYPDELKDYKNKIILKNPRKIYLTKNNVGSQENWDKLIDALK